MQPQDPRGGFGGFGRDFGREFGRDFGRGGGRHRARRGDVQAAVLNLLADEEMHGYQIITELAERSGGVWRPGAGSIYPTLRNLEQQGLISARDEDGKRVFRLTDAGRRAAAEADGTPWQEFDQNSPAVRLRTATQNLFSAVAQLESIGTEAQISRTVEVLNTARKSIYLMLAEEES
jgi:DNA-binding PadR family transcriptional regulator